MADIIDQANEHAEMFLTIAHRNRAAGFKSLDVTGTCYNCGEVLPEGRLFCDADCREDFEKRQGRKM